MKEVSPTEASDLMQADSDYIYLDVRSIPEFEAGHAERAINIPLLHFDPAVGMRPNEQFTRVVEANMDKDAKLVVGCKAGGRSAKACEILNQLGYTNVTNIRGGFVAATDAMGRVVEPGWSMLNLPTCKECSGEAQYETLAAKGRS
jgi:rhodanese-related sulfurtransferase